MGAGQLSGIASCVAQDLSPYYPSNPSERFQAPSCISWLGHPSISYRSFHLLATVHTFLRTFELCINFTVLDILLGIPNYGKHKDIDILNAVILFAKSYIYSSKRDEMAIDFYTFLVKLKHPW